MAIAQPPHPAGPDSVRGEPVVLVDLRTPSAAHDQERRTLENALEADPRVEPVEPQTLPSTTEGVVDPVADVERRFRGHEEQLSGTVMGTLVRRLGARIGLVLQPSGQVHIWGLPAGAQVARRVSGAPLSEPDYVARLVHEWVQRQDHPEASRAPDVATLLRTSEPRSASKGRDKDRQARWWVYAGVGAAVAVAAVFIISDQLATDRQRIELTLP